MLEWRYQRPRNERTFRRSSSALDGFGIVAGVVSDVNGRNKRVSNMFQNF